MKKLSFCLLMVSSFCLSVDHYYDSLNDAQLKKYCESKRELSDACVAYVQFKHCCNFNYPSLTAEKAMKAQRKEAKKMGEIIHNIGKEMFEEETKNMLKRNEK